MRVPVPTQLVEQPTGRRERQPRLATDLLVADLGAEPFTWGGAELTAPADLRTDYLTALRHADTTADSRHLSIRATHQLITHPNLHRQATSSRSSEVRSAPVLPTTHTNSSEQLLSFAAVLWPQRPQKPSSRIGKGPLACGDIGGAEGTRTPDPLVANEVRYQLRHSPVVRTKR